LGAFVDFAGGAKGAGRRFEQGFDFVMIAAAPENFQMQITARRAAKALPKILDGIGLELKLFFIAVIGSQQRRAGKSGFKKQKGAAAYIRRGAGQGLIHGKEAASVTPNAPFFTQCFGEALAQNNARIFHQMVLINLKIAFRGYFQIKKPVAGKGIEHVGHKTDGIIQRRRALPVNVQLYGDFSFLCFS
jgi:hypothetical protein